MRVLIGCESSGIIRDAFIARGHNAISCDLLPSEREGPHYQGDVFDIIDDGFDLGIFHPDCTYLTNSAAWAYGDGPYHQKIKPETPVGQARRELRRQALDFVLRLMKAQIPRTAIENPIGAINTSIRPPDQYIQPHEYGHDASKKTGLWLKGLPKLSQTEYIAPRMVNGHPRWANQTDSGQNRLSPSEDRWKDRARTYQGWADAMADQWGGLL